MPKLSVLITLFFINIQAVHADCWNVVSDRYNIPVALLKCLAKVESNGNKNAIGRLGNGLDYGLIQINEWWLPKLKKFGIEATDLFDACTNLHVGAWILANNFHQYGYTWRSIGVYNAGTARDPETEKKRIKYAKKIYNCMN